MINKNWLAPVFITVLLSACASTPESPTPELLSNANTLIDSGVTQYNQANFSKANELFEQAMYLYRSIDNPRGTASSYIDLAKSALGQNNIDSAEHWIKKAQTIVSFEHLAYLQDHITIINSSIAIEKNDFSRAKTLLTPILEPGSSLNTETQLAATQNRTRIAFAENTSAAEWTEQYAKLVKNSQPHSEARLARFRAALSTNPTEQDKYYQQALDIYRHLAWRPGLAATLSEWAKQNIKAHDYSAAENRLERALLIRLDLRDGRSTIEILKQLNGAYAELGQTIKQQRAAYWSTQLGKDHFDRWDEVLKDFES
jgi:tetratricopeptide (TPR) repeat protein